MERVQGIRSNTVLYVEPNTNFSYYRDHADNNFCHYFRCSRDTCGGRVIWRFGAVNEIELSENHKNEPDADHVNVLRFKEALRRRAADEVISLKNIYIDEEVRYHEASLQVGGFRGAIEQMMKRARKHGTPPIPLNFQQIDVILRNPRYRRFSIELGPAERAFYRGIMGAEGQQVIYLISPTVQHYARQLETPLKLHMDATFSVVPRAGGALQLFVIHYMYNNASPIAMKMIDSRISVNAQQILDVNGNVALFLRRMSHAVDGLEEQLNPIQGMEEPEAVHEIQANLPPAEVEPENVVAENLDLHQQVENLRPVTPPRPQEAVTCLICAIEERTHAFIPCGHISVCAECAEELTNRRMLDCVLCRSNSFGIFRIFN
ncbi:hypothetical protein RN001_008241 [Aquatica leii]|uniref:RING-type domain-containing protein n=1 Tax=Aquatica leii TaxID=1421715 RepID=A0AAN7SRA1_9COLE|nr:hypothetical protein RN001_008241 [Aquatica leii]